LDEIREMMDVAAPADGLSAYPVSKAVNLVRNNGPQLTVQVELGEPETLF